VTPESTAAGIRAWTPASRTEPRLRVGVILDVDAQRTVHLRPPSTGGQLHGLKETISLAPQCDVLVRLAGDKVAVSVQGELVGEAPHVRVQAALPERLERGVGILVRDVVAGRGFHWQKHIDQTLAGDVEVFPGKHGLVVVNELGLEDYLAGVITAEMSGACPVDFLQAQCVVARSWLLAMSEPKHMADPFDRCNDDCCQRYQGTGDLSDVAIAAVRGTRGIVLHAPDGNVLDANYAKSCGGVSETPEHVWGVAKPGVSAVVDAPADADERRFFPITESNLDEFLDGAWLASTRCYCSPNVVPVDRIQDYLGRVDEADDYFRWTVRYERSELEGLLREKLPEARHLAAVRAIRVVQRGVSGRATRIEIEWENVAGEAVTSHLDSEYRIREVLHRKFLYSSAIAFHVKRAGDGKIESVEIRGAGWGHGVGLCQIGALGMALEGIDHETICLHYFPQSRLTQVYD